MTTNTSSFHCSGHPGHHSSLQTCPSDVLHFVIGFLDIEDLLNLRLTSRTLHSIVTPNALRNISLLWGRGGYPGIRSRLSTCSFDIPPSETRRHEPGLTNLYVHARHLTICAIDYSVYKAISESNLPAVLSTLRRLRSLRSVTLRWYFPQSGIQEFGISPMYLQEVICSAILIATGGALEQLVVTPKSDMSGPYHHSVLGICSSVTPNLLPQCFLGIKTLKKFSFTYEMRYRRCYSAWGYRSRVDVGMGVHVPCLPRPFEDDVWRIVEANPGIEDLTVRYSCIKSGLNWEALQLSGHAFKHLNLRGIQFPSASMDASCFTSLTHLTMDTASFDTAIPVANLWVILSKNRPQSLISIRTAQVTSSFLSFLRSFAGLKALTIGSLDSRFARDGEAFSPRALSALAHEFFTSALPNHAPTLQHLSISFADDVSNVPGWTYSPSYFIPNFRLMSSLRQLALHPRGMEEGGQTEPEIAISAYQSILDGIGASYPGVPGLRGGDIPTPGAAGILSSLESLEIFWSDEGVDIITGEEDCYIGATELVETIVGSLRSKHGVPRTLTLLTVVYYGLSLFRNNVSQRVTGV
ncbi:hypothetical protein AX16_004505 [Volvariella volvacea WC 439]|nr:hypothetical protein AX16_004505 [Volvariella volvacea WC 439]